MSTLVSLAKSKQDELNGSVYEMPATPQQVRLWHLNEATPNPAWNVAVRFRVSGPLDREKFERALQMLASRHEALRTSLNQNSGAVVERIVAQVVMPIEWCDLRSLAETAQEKEVTHLSLKHACQVIDLTRPPLFRVRVLRLSEEEHILLWNAHHSICDGWSVGLLASDLMHCYGEGVLDRELTALDELDYGDYAVWLQTQRESAEYEVHRNYWKQRLQGLSVSGLPASWRNADSATETGSIQSTVLPRALTDSILAVAQRHHSTFFHAVLSAFAVLLRGHQSSSEVAVETPISGRDQSELESVVGTFMNTLPLRIRVDGDIQFSNLLHEVRDRVIDSFEHAQFRYEDMLAELVQEGTIAFAEKPLTPVTFICQQDFVHPITAGGVALSAIPSVSPGALRPLTVFMVERADGWRLSCEVDNRVVSRAAGSVLLEDFQRLLTAIAAHPEESAAQVTSHAGLALIRSAESNAQTEPWTGTGFVPPGVEKSGGLRRIPATEFQRRFWRLDSLNRGGVAYHVRIRLQLQGACNVDALREAFAIVVRRNEILRTTLEEENDHIWQVIHPEPSIDFQFLPATTPGPEGSRSDSEHRADQAILDREGQKGFSLSTGPMFRVRLLQLEADRYWLAVTLSHGIADGWSSGLFLEQLQQAYEQLLAGGKIETNPHPVQFSVYAETERRMLASPEKVRREAWWQQYLSGVWTPLALPQDVADSDSEVGSARAGFEMVLLDAEIVARVRYFARECQSTMFAVFGALFQALLSRYSGQNDILFLTPHANRTDNTETIMGPLADPICLTCHLNAGTTFRELVMQFSDQSMDAMENALPLNLVTPFVDMRVGTQYYPLNQITFFYQRAFVHGMEWKGLHIDSLPDVPSVTGTEWQLGVVERNEGVFLEFLYDATLYSKATIQMVERHYARLLDEAARMPDMAVSQLKILTPQEVGQYENAVSVPPVIASLLPRKLTALAGKAGSVEASIASSTPAVSLTSSEQDVLRIWRQILKVEDLNLESNFFDLGGHSLLLARMQILMKREFNVQLTAAEVFRQPTVGALAAWLDKARSGNTSMMTRNSLLVSEYNPHIVPIQPLGSGRPIFVISQSMIFRTLAAELGTEQPVYAVQALEQDTETMATAGFDELIDFYIRLIRAVQPSGPYRVAGWCVSAWIAYGVARRLEQQGEAIEMAMILDAWAPAYWSRQPRLRHALMLGVYYMQRLRWIGSQRREGEQSRSNSFFRRSLRGLAVTVANLATRLRHAHVPLDARLHEEERLGRQLEVTARLASESGPLQGNALFFRSEEEPLGLLLAKDMGWSQLVGRPVRVDVVPGDHHGMFNLPGARIMAMGARAMLGLPVVAGSDNAGAAKNQRNTASGAHESVPMVEV